MFDFDNPRCEVEPPRNDVANAFYGFEGPILGFLNAIYEFAKEINEIEPRTAGLEDGFTKS
jgi:hypothetical protein